MGEPDDLDSCIAELLATNPEFAQRWAQHQLDLRNEKTQIMWSGTTKGIRTCAKAYKTSVKFWVRPRPQYLVKRRKPRNRW